MFKAIVLGNVLLFISTLFVQLYFTILHFQKKLKNMYFFKIKNCMLNMKKICKIRKAHSGQPSDTQCCVSVVGTRVLEGTTAHQRNYDPVPFGLREIPTSLVFLQLSFCV